MSKYVVFCDTLAFWRIELLYWHRVAAWNTMQSLSRGFPFMSVFQSQMKWFLQTAESKSMRRSMVSPNITRHSNIPHNHVGSGISDVAKRYVRYSWVFHHGQDDDDGGTFRGYRQRMGGCRPLEPRLWQLMIDSVSLHLTWTLHYLFMFRTHWATRGSDPLEREREWLNVSCRRGVEAFKLVLHCCAKWPKTCFFIWHFLSAPNHISIWASTDHHLDHHHELFPSSCS